MNFGFRVYDFGFWLEFGDRLPLALLLLKKFKHKRVGIKIYPVKDPLLVPLRVKTISFLLGGTLQHNNLVIP